MCVNRGNDIFTIYHLFTSNREEYENTRVLNVPRGTIYLKIYKGDPSDSANKGAKKKNVV